MRSALDRNGAALETTLRAPRELVQSISWLVLLSFLLLLLYGDVLQSLVRQWWNDPDYSHGFFVALFAGYILWRKRERLLAVQLRPTNLGLLLMLAALCMLLLGWLGAELFISRISLLALLSGMVLFLAGREMLVAVAFPLAYLFWMIPIPSIVLNQITFPLQLLASRLATDCLELLQVPVLRDGNVLVMSNYSLEVVEACSGIRSLMTLAALAAAYGHLFEQRRLVRYGLIMLMLPIAIATNAVRIVVAGLLAHRYGAVAAEGFLHEFSGWFIFLSALGLLFLCHWILRLRGAKAL